MRDAVALVKAKLEYGDTTTRNAIRWARKKELIAKKGQGYYPMDFLNEHMAEKAKEELAPVQAPAMPATTF